MLLPAMPPPPVTSFVLDLQQAFPSEVARGADPSLADNGTEERPSHYETTATGILVRNVTLDPSRFIEIQRFDPSMGGGYTVPAYNVVDQRTRIPVTHPLTQSLLYVRGGDRIGIASMNFDLVYNEHGYVVGLIDDVVCQAVIRNYHTYPPLRDCWEHMVLFTLPYRQVANVDGVVSYLETDFLFYTWDDPDTLIVRRIVILQMHKRYNDTYFTTFHPVWLGVIGDYGVIEYSFTYDVDDTHYYWNRYLEAREATIIAEDCYGYTCPISGD